MDFVLQSFPISTFLFFILPLVFLLHASIFRRPRRPPLPPGPKGLPLLGNMLMRDQLTHRGLAALAKRYGGIFHLHIGFVHMVVISDPDAARNVLQAAHRLKILFGLAGFEGTELHGNLTQVQLLDALELFKKQQVYFLISTDVAARDLMEKTIVLALATGQKRFSVTLCKFVEKYAEILASQGQLTMALEYVKLLGSEELTHELVILRDRISLSTESEIIFSQIKDFDQLWWLSIVASVMSFTYSTIGLGLGVAQITANGKIGGSLTGIIIGTVTQTQKVWRSFQALGDIAFAYSYSIILIEIQDTLKSPPSEAKTMKKATLVSVSVTTLFYMLCGAAGYAPFGDMAPGNLLTGFGFYI
ncbi:amino acid permease 3-like [Cucumis melo var. makuwa]|uniref:Amino acid permease 3-like n=1 Tax=Cucumis melo var. makuwa TaxID=1194695 RepID=A0A5A7VFA3_CUCMM|nr:amino acid permease 3-like [Cucumis melo var. makuwa]